MSTASEPDASKRHKSELPDPRQRFLARVVDHTLAEHLRTADDFLRHFPPQVIVSSLARADELRVKLLVAATGTHEKIALKKSIGSAVEDLELALAEQTTTPTAILGIYGSDDKVRYLDARKLWAFVVEDEFYKAGSRADAGQVELATKRLTFIIECALSEGVLTLKDVADAVTFDEIAAALPAAEAREVVKYALGIARAGTPLSEERFLSVVPLPSLISHLPLERTFQRVVIARIAEPNGLVENVSGSTEGAASPPEVPPTPVVESAGPVAPAVETAATATASAASSETQAAVPDEDEVRRGVIDRLRTIDRLPPSNADLSTPILLSIDSMYAELWSLNDDDEREACMRESFPNETLLRTAMLALIEQLDPSVDTRDPIIRDADVSGLMKIVLFEERRRRDGQAQSRRGSTPAPNRSRRTVPPPLPRTNTPPPLPGEGRSNPPPLPLELKRDN